MKNLGVYVGIAGLAAGIIFFSVTYYLSQPNPNLVIINPFVTVYDQEIDFHLANANNGVAYVDKIELVVTDFEILSECNSISVHAARPYQFITERIHIQSIPNNYPINSIYDFDMDELFQTNEGIKYGSGEMDQFTIPYSLENRSDGGRLGHSFDFFIRVHWSDATFFSEKKVLDSGTINAERLESCDLEN